MSAFASDVLLQIFFLPAQEPQFKSGQVRREKHAAACAIQRINNARRPPFILKISLCDLYHNNYISNGILIDFEFN